MPVDLATVDLRGQESIGSSRLGRYIRAGGRVGAQQKPRIREDAGLEKPSLRTSRRTPGRCRPRGTLRP